MIEKIPLAYALAAKLVFPEGFSIGNGGKEGNSYSIERNGEGKPVLRGSSIAGLLRAKMKEDPFYRDELDYYFGCALESGCERQESRVRFYDMDFDDMTEEAMHNKICRHTGAPSVENKGLFSVERIAPGAEGGLFITLTGDKGETEERRDEDFLRRLAELLNGGILVGGNTSRGTGRCLLKEQKYYWQKFDLSSPADSAAWLDLLYAETKNVTGEVVLQERTVGNCFMVQLRLRLAAGQDLLSSGGSDMSPVFTRKADGKSYWKIPGSSFRGVLKDWISRLAARDGEILHDSVATYQKSGDRKEVESRQDIEKSDVVSDLFGYLGKKGRIHFSDACSVYPCAAHKEDIQYRTHVVIDRFTGGSNDGKLFDDFVLIDPEQKLSFELEISIMKPREKELHWLEKALQAMHFGLVRLGSSKASGHLEIQNFKVLSNPLECSFVLPGKEM